MKAMRPFFQVLVALSCYLMISCHHPDTDLYKWFSLTYYRHGQLWSGILKEPMTVQSYPCIGRVRFDSAGRINHFRLSRDFGIRGHMIPENSIVEVYGNIMQIVPSRPVEIQDYLIPGSEYINNFFTLDQHGHLIQFFPEEDIEVNGILCMGLRNVQMYPDGRLWVCFLAKDIKADGVIYPEGTYVLFDENGNLQEFSGELYEEIRKGLGL
jgi:hypothetical protein